MCDIGRFEYHWIEGDDRLQRPLLREASGTLKPVDWREALTKTVDRITAAGGPGALRFLVSAHASLEELFLLGRLGSAFGMPEDGVVISWRAREKQQPANSKFKVPPVDAPNVNGARDMGFPARAGADGGPDLSAFRQQIEQGHVSALYVFDPGPDGSIGDVSWILKAREAGKLPLLIVQGVLLTELARAADVVLPGASSMEKDALYVNQQGMVQGAAKALNPPGDAQEDWQVLVNLALALGVTMEYTNSAHVRADVAQAMSGTPGYESVSGVAFAQPVGAQNWLQASNPSERWKWDVMFQDLPPVKFAGRPEPTSIPGAISLQKID
jgi:predicted molibdopterin-dependent oxidoreductase YjgC